MIIRLPVFSSNNDTRKQQKIKKTKPHTRQITSKLAENDDFLISVLKKERRIRQSVEDIEKTETLTPSEKIKTDEFKKSFWEEAGTEEFSRASKMAYQIVNTYVEDGMMQLKTLKLKK